MMWIMFVVIFHWDCPDEDLFLYYQGRRRFFALFPQYIAYCFVCVFVQLAFHLHHVKEYFISSPFKSPIFNRRSYSSVSSSTALGFKIEYGSRWDGKRFREENEEFKKRKRRKRRKFRVFYTCICLLRFIHPSIRSFSRTTCGKETRTYDFSRSVGGILNWNWMQELLGNDEDGDTGRRRVEAKQHGSESYKVSMRLVST